MTDRSTNQEADTIVNPVAAVEQFMRAVDDLLDVYREETKALNASDIRAFFALQDRKISVAQDYHAGIAGLIERKNEVLTIRPDIKSLIANKHAEFIGVSKDNADALGQMSRTVDRMGKRIMKSARDAAIRESATYGSRGRMSTSHNKPITMGLNESA